MCATVKWNLKNKIRMETQVKFYKVMAIICLPLCQQEVGIDTERYKLNSNS
jgi:hypothetical protein